VGFNLAFKGLILHVVFDWNFVIIYLSNLSWNEAVQF